MSKLALISRECLRGIHALTRPMPITKAAVQHVQTEFACSYESAFNDINFWRWQGMVALVSLYSLSWIGAVLALAIHDDRWNSAALAILPLLVHIALTTLPNGTKSANA